MLLFDPHEVTLKVSLGIVSRQRIRERTAAIQIDSQGRVRAIVGGRRRAGGVGAPKLEDVALSKRIEDAAIAPPPSSRCRSGAWRPWR